MTHILEVDSVNFSIGERKILSDIYLKCQTGEIVGVFGRNGSGKSSLMKIIFGTLIPQFKVVRIDGKYLKTPYLEPKGISFLTQDDFIPKHLSVRKAIDLFLAKYQIECFLQDDFIEKIIDSKISTLSGGESKYVHVKLILSINSKFSLIDEPFSGVSPIMVERIISLIQEASTDKGIIITDHNYRNVLTLSTQIYHIKDGYGKMLNHPMDLIAQGYLKEGML
jgi:ABC-type lipopolysaccharide export system ATPase subunit